jgi:hypothetical protein
MMPSIMEWYKSSSKVIIFLSFSKRINCFIKRNEYLTKIHDVNTLSKQTLIESNTKLHIDLRECSSHKICFQLMISSQNV